jgi:hypothetical protein
MSTLGFNTAALANVVTPFSPVAKLAVGQENVEGKGEAFAPVEEPAAAAAAGKKDSGDVIGNNVTGNSTAENSTTGNNGADRVKAKEKEQIEQQVENQKIIRQLASRDREVRAHEQAHSAVGGQYTGGPSYTYKRGPDGVSYAVGGEVSISAPPTGDPEVTLRAAEQIKRAALAPSDPSPQDRRVAAQAGQTALQARVAIFQQQTEARIDASGEAKQERAEKLQQETDGEKIEDDELSYQERLESLRQASRRSALLNDQLVTLEKVDDSSNVGEVVNELA